MAEEKQEGQEDQPAHEGQKKGGSKKLIIIIAAAVIVLLAGGFFAYTMLLGGKDKGKDAAKEEKKDVKTALIAIDPFVLNLAEQGRFLKVTMQLELSDATHQPIINDKIPQLRDAIITLLSSKSVESVSSPEGKFQLKDELLLRVNQVTGKDSFKNIFFTEFVMQ